MTKESSDTTKETPSWMGDGLAKGLRMGHAHELKRT
jgi:hypothetical protein